MVHTFNSNVLESHNFNSSNKEVETGMDRAGQSEEYKAGVDKSAFHSV